MRRTIDLAAAREVSAKSVEQVEVTECLNFIPLDDAAADALENIVEQPAHAKRAKSQPGFPVRAPAIEGDVEGSL